MGTAKVKLDMETIQKCLTLAVRAGNLASQAQDMTALKVRLRNRAIAEIAARAGVLGQLSLHSLVAEIARRESPRLVGGGRTAEEMHAYVYARVMQALGRARR